MTQKLRKLAAGQLRSAGANKLIIMDNQPRLPSKLYKYVKLNRIDILTRQTILFSLPCKLNDPFEMWPRFEQPENDIHSKWDQWVRRQYDLLPVEYRKLKTFQEFQMETEQANGSWEDCMALLEEDNANKLPELFQSEASSTFGILCLSEHRNFPDNLLMWAHYAESHTGLVFQFDTGGDFFSHHFIQPVSYEDERRVFTRDGDGKDIFLTKFVEWRYEAEWRLFRSLSELKKSKLDNGQEGYFGELPARHISAIFLGCRISPPDKEKILAVLRVPGNDHIEAFQARLHPKRYALIFNPLNRKGVS